MKGFSQNASSYVAILKWALLALVVVGFVRFVLGPVGVPITVAGKLASLTVVLLVSVIAYAVYFARTGGKIGDVLVTAVVLVVVYTAVLAVFLSLSVALGWDTYYTDPSHYRGNLTGHVGAHIRVIPFAVLIGTVLGTVVFGGTWLMGRLVGGLQKEHSVG